VGKHGLLGQCVVAGNAVAGNAVAGNAVAGNAVAGNAVAGNAVAGNAVAGNAVATAGHMAASTVMAGSRVLPSSASRSAAVRRCRVPLFTGRNDGGGIGINLLVPTGYSGGRGSLQAWRAFGRDAAAVTAWVPVSWSSPIVLELTSHFIDLKCADE